MSCCNVERSCVDAASVLARVRAETIERGGTFEGDAAGGRYVLRTPLGAIEGTYTSDGDRVRVVVERKPAFVPCALLARTLDELFASVSDR